MLAQLTVHDLAQQMYVETNLMKTLVEGLRAALNWKVMGDDFSRKLSTVTFISKSFRRHLERLMTLEEIDGYMDIVLDTKPNLSKMVEALREEHEQFRRGGKRIVHQLERASANDLDAFNKMCGDMAELLTRYDRHSLREANVFQQAFEQEEGGEG